MKERVKNMKTRYIKQLDAKTQNAIKKDLIIAFNEIGLKQSNINVEIDNAMSSRLSDLSDTINIEPYIKKTRKT